MEIDFLGLNSRLADFDLIEQKNLEAREFVVSESGEDDISLSLYTSSQLDRSCTEFSDFRQKRTWKFPSEKMISANSSCSLDSNDREREQSCLSLVGRPILQPSSFMHNHNHKLAMLRNIYELPTQPASATMFSQAEHKMYMAGNASSEDTHKSPRGYVPTVAMARSATLARFLMKRSHRLTQSRKSHFVGGTLGVIEACNMNIIKCNKKIYSSVRS